jgi:signal recognition particle subunit SRP54
LNQLRTIKKLGRIKDILGLIPGLNKLPLDQIDEKQLVYVEAILSSMTPKERKKPQILDGSRKNRIAKGSGTEISRVNAVLKQYDDMKEMFKKVGDMARKQNNGGQIGSNYTPPKVKKKRK